MLHRYKVKALSSSLSVRTAEGRYCCATQPVKYFLQLLQLKTRCDFVTLQQDSCLKLSMGLLDVGWEQSLGSQSLAFLSNLQKKITWRGYCECMHVCIWGGKGRIFPGRVFRNAVSLEHPLTGSLVSCGDPCKDTLKDSISVLILTIALCYCWQLSLFHCLGVEHSAHSAHSHCSTRWCKVKVVRKKD